MGRAASEGTQVLSAASVASGTLAGPPAEALSGVLLAAVPITAITRPKRLPEAVVAVPAAAVVIFTGALPLDQARDEAGRLLPVLAFLGAILVVAHVCQRDGLFSASGARLARLGSPARLLRGVFGLAAMTTALLSLDTTVVLLTPVVHDTAVRLRMRPKPHVHACTHLANSASLLLPVSNLTNLLAFSVAGLTLIQFGGPNLSYARSLATLLWRRLLADRDHAPDLAEFTRLGLLTVPAGLVLATLALWAALHV